eukprot:m.25143 g.25143  ORF g.25143 m.25143 type:complete len:364 (+) comp14888_c0_seq1:215-1306(+)
MHTRYYWGAGLSLLAIIYGMCYVWMMKHTHVNLRMTPALDLFRQVNVSVNNTTTATVTTTTTIVTVPVVPVTTVPVLPVCNQTVGFLHYIAPVRGQGIGNALNGLYVAHLVASKYCRKVCVVWPDFTKAFVYNNSGCANPNTHKNKDHDLHLWNFGQSSKNDQIDRVLGDPTIVSATLDANEYDQFGTWPETRIPLIPEVYSPSPELLTLLHPACTTSFSTPPCLRDTVIHLRKGDGAHDVRGAFGDASVFDRLVHCFKRGYLLADQQVVYDKLKHLERPIWEAIKHSSAGGAKLQIWADWITVVNAKHVYHTPSGFSESAIRVSSAYSRRLLESCGECFMLQEETWRRGFNKFNKTCMVPTT